MSDKEDYPKEEPSTGEQPKTHHQRKPWQKRNLVYPHQQKKDPEEIPVLQYGLNGNFHIYKEAMACTAMKLYGNLGKLIKLGKYYELVEPDAKAYNLENDPTGSKKLAYHENLKEYYRELNTMKNNRPKLYALLLQYLSDESLDEVKRSDKFETVDQETDPEGLWQIIEETHKVNTVSKVQSITKKAARATYQKMRQGAFELIITYKERFNDALKGYVE